MAGFDWKAVVRTVAPAVASVFGTPIAGMGVKALVDAFLPTDTPPEKQEELLAQMFQKPTPETMLKLKELDQRFALDMQKLELDILRIGNEDRDSARKLAAVDTEHVAARLTYFVAGSFAATLVCIGILAYAHPSESPSPYIAGLVGTIVGAVISEFKQMTAFHFGRNVGSERTKEMLFNSVQQGGNGK